ncbi:MAG: DUF3237 family protein [Bacteroidaceae bacterium]|nr:DUF3237 family protein [Bacteroidaceae bacterium]
MKEILTILILIGQTFMVSNDKGDRINFINFSGNAESEYFTGDVMPGGVDTQKMNAEYSGLSARYVLKGKDKSGQDCSIFIENNGKFGEEYTRPVIITDSKELGFLNDPTHLKGKLDFAGGGLKIRIYYCDEPVVDEEDKNAEDSKAKGKKEKKNKK